MDFIIRPIDDRDRDSFIEYSLQLAKYSREMHDDMCKKDDFDIVLDNIRARSELSFRDKDKEGLQIFVAEYRGSIVGYCLLRIYEEDKCADNGTGDIGLFDELYVDNSARGHGIGNSLIEKAFTWFKGRDIKRVKLHAYSWNKSAVRLYEQFGFRQYVSSYQCFINS